MGCNCFTTKQIDEIYSKFSLKMDDRKSKQTLLSRIFWKFFDFLALIVLVNSIPLITLYIAGEVSRGNRYIRLSDFFKITYNAEPQFTYQD